MKTLIAATALTLMSTATFAAEVEWIDLISSVDRTEVWQVKKGSVATSTSKKWVGGTFRMVLDGYPRIMLVGMELRDCTEGDTNTIYAEDLVTNEASSKKYYVGENSTIDYIGGALCDIGLEDSI